MKKCIDTPFDSIENAQQYIRLLAEVVAEAKRDIGDEIALGAQETAYSRVRALRVVDYNLEKLQRYLAASGRTLNDLRSLRRLIHEERVADSGGTEVFKMAKTA